MLRLKQRRFGVLLGSLLALLPLGAAAQQAAVPPAGATATAQAPAATADSGTSQPWTLHEQVTWIDQYHPSFDSPYEGANSLTADSQSERTFSFSVFSGYRLVPGTEVYFQPEVFQGHGLSNTLGMAGYPNGEAVKAAFPNFHYNTSQLYLQQTFGLGGETEKLDDGHNQVGDVVDVDRVTLSIGKFAANTFFDDNAYSHDTRTQFLNWALWESAAWDYPADIVGYTAGFVAEWNTKAWEIHYGIFMEPTESNGARLDYHVGDAHGQILQFDRRYAVGDLTGTVRPFVFWNEARMGSYAIADANPGNPSALTDSRAYRSKAGLGVSWDQQLTADLGVFARLSWDDGKTESFAFTEVDRSVAAGLSTDGAPWSRRADTLGAAVVINGIVPEHQQYLAEGGLQGLILGDGALNYGLEEILEVYYTLQVTKWLGISPDYQFAEHPGYNRDRGPVSIYAVRAHFDF